MDAVTNIDNQKLPGLLKGICYVMLVLAGVKMLTLFIYWVAPNLFGSKPMPGVDTWQEGGLFFQITIFALCAVKVWSIFKILAYQKIGYFAFIALSFILLFLPVFWGIESYVFKPTAFTLTLLPIFLLYRYFKDMK